MLHKKYTITINMWYMMLLSEGIFRHDDHCVIPSQVYLLLLQSVSNY
jgi:hypothetical protein